MLDQSDLCGTNFESCFAVPTQPNNTPGLFGQGNMPLASGMVCFMHLESVCTLVYLFTSVGCLSLGFKCDLI